MKVTDVIKDLSIIEKIYDVARLVNPYSKEVYDTICFGDFELKISDSLKPVYCYHIWNRDEVCKNCISTRTIQDKKPHVKLEFNDKLPFLVTTMYVNDGDKPCVLELVRKVDLRSMNIVNMNVADQLSKLTAKIITDSLTGAFNRRFITEQTPYLLDFYKKHNKNFSYIICDIDNFRNINTKYGHVGGDYVLKAFVNRINIVLRPKVDWVARYGGDEFVIYLNDTNVENALKIINRIKDSVSAKPIIYNSQKIFFTVSYGVSTPSNDDTPKTILEKADRKLYTAKNDGKNKVSF